MPTIPTLTLKTVPLQGAAFTGSQYNYQGEDLAILRDSIAQKEARLEKAYQQMGAIDSALGGIESQLNKREAGWFTNYKNNIKKQIQGDIDVGNPGAAIRSSYALAGKTASDTAVLSRIEAEKQHTEWENTLKQKREKGEISPDAFKWAIAKNPYETEDLLDSDGNVIGVTLKDKQQVYNTMKWDDVAAKAASFFRPDVTQSERKGGSTGPSVYNTDNAKLQNLKGKIGSASSAWASGHQIEQVEAEDIINTIGGLLGIPDLLNQAIQDWEVSVWNYDQLSPGEKKDRVAQDLVVRGSTISLKEYLNQKSRLLANALAYKKESTSSGSQSGFEFTSKSGTDIEGIEPGDYGKTPEQPAGEGPKVTSAFWNPLVEVVGTITNRLDGQAKGTKQSE